MSESVYLDYAAATPLDAAVLEAMQPYFQEQFYNPSALYLPAQQVQRDLLAARQTVAKIIGAQASEIIFTAGGTESTNLAILGVMRRYPQANVIVSTVEHEAVLAPARQFSCREVSVGADGRVKAQAVADAVDDQTVLVSIMYANNEIGTVEPLRDIARQIALIRASRRQSGNGLPLYLHTDACQAANYLDLQVARLGVDLMTLNGGKIYGPKQSGVLYVRGGIELEPLLYGGGQEHGLRSGTENVAACIGFAKALEIAQAGRHEESKRLQQLQAKFIDGLGRRLSQVTFNGSTRFRLPNNVHITVPGADNERLLIQLEQAGVLAAAGSACSASNDTPSHVLRAIGLSDAEARASVRFSFGRQTDVEQINRAVETLSKLAAS